MLSQGYCLSACLQITLDCIFEAIANFVYFQSMN